MDCWLKLSETTPKRLGSFEVTLQRDVVSFNSAAAAAVRPIRFRGRNQSIGVFGKA